MLIWIIIILLSLIFVFLLVMLLLRKINFDAIHQNFLDLEDQFGGEVIRNGFAVRPRFAGSFEGRNFSISLTTDKSDGVRQYFMAVSMEAKSPVSFSILGKSSLAQIEIEAERQERMSPLLDGEYFIEVSKKPNLKKLNLGKISEVLPDIHPFGYILAGQRHIIVERGSQSIVQDTRLENLKPLLEGINRLAVQIQ